MRLAASALLGAVLALGVARADDPQDDHYDEEIIVLSAADARHILHVQLEHLGYHRQRRVRGKVIYKNYRRWKPKVIIDDDGWMLVSGSRFVGDRFLVLPGLLGMSGQVQSKRAIAQAEAEVVEATWPALRQWRTALAAELEGAPGAAPPTQQVAPPSLREIAAVAGGLAIGVDPLQLQPRPPLAEDELAARHALAVRTRAQGVGGPQVHSVLQSLPRHLALPPDGWDDSAAGTTLHTPTGAVLRDVSQLAAVLRAAGPGPGVDVLQVGDGSAYLAALAAELGATVTFIAHDALRQLEASQTLRAYHLDHRVRLLSGDPGRALEPDARFDVVLADGPDLDIGWLLERVAAGGQLLELTDDALVHHAPGPDHVAVRREPWPATPGRAVLPWSLTNPGHDPPPPRPTGWEHLEGADSPL